jgi:glycosyltransferase involved in cell wall biosynthesis
VLFGVRVVVVVPAFDEAPRIGRVLRTMPAAVDHVIVVDDGSTDGTAAAARATPARRGVEIVRHGKRRGVGAAIASGYRRALDVCPGARDAIVVMAGDGQMAPCDLPHLVRPVARGEAGYVKGNRFAAPDVRAVTPPARYMGGRLFSWMTSRALGVRVEDAQCGYTAIARSACARLALDDLWPSFGYPNDLLGQLVARGVTIREVPVRPVYADEVSKLRLRHVALIPLLVARAWARRAFAAPQAPASPERASEDGGDVREGVVEIEAPRQDAGREL